MIIINNYYYYTYYYTLTAAVRHGMVWHGTNDIQWTLHSNYHSPFRIEFQGPGGWKAQRF